MWLTIRTGDQAGRVLEVTGERFVVGRDDSCDLVLRDAKVSRQHAAIKVLPDGAVVEDLGSTNGTIVNGRRISGPTMIGGNESIQFGDTTILTSAGEPSRGATMVGVMPPPPSEAEPPPTGEGAETQALGPEALPGFGSPPPGHVAAHAPPDALVPPPPDTAAPPPPPVSPYSGPPRGFTAERKMLRRSARTATILGVVSVLVAVALVVLVLTDVIPLGDDEAAPPPVENEEPEELNVADVVERVTPSTVLVNTLKDGQPFSGGTGWVIDGAQGHIVTNFHVVNGGTSFTVGVGDQERPAEILGGAPCEDLAVLKLEDTSGLQAVELGSQGELRQGDEVVAIGFPTNASDAEEPTVTEGVVSIVQTSFDLVALDVPNYPNVIQTDAAINPGNSGGPLVNLEAKLVGVNSAGITRLNGRDIQGQGFAIGVDRVKEIVPTLQQGQSIGWTGAGIEHDPNANGLVVDSALPGSPAEAAGLGSTPVTVSAINGQTVDNTLVSYCNAIGEGASGGTVTFTVDGRDVQVGLK